MRTIYRSVNLNEMCRVDNLSGVAFTGESGHQFVITGFNGENPVFFEGGIAGQFRCPDGTPIEFTPSYTDIDSEGRAVVTLPDNCYLHGSGPFGIIITNVINEKPGVIYAAAGFMQTGESASPVDPENVVNVDAIVAIIDDMYTAIAACAEATEYIPDVIAPEYNPLSTYAIGDWVSAYDQDNGWGLYWCNTPITTAGTGWGTNKTKFTKITVGKQITDTRISADGVLTLNLNGYQTINCTISSTATLTASGTTYQSKKIPRNLMWDTVKITANSTGATYATFFTGAFPSTITSGADVSGALATGETGRHEIATGTTLEFKIPADAAYIIITTKSTSNRTPSAVVVSTKVYNDLASYMNTADTKMIVGDRAINTAGLLVAPYDDLNTLPRGTVVTYIGQTPSNVPSDLTGTSFTALTYNYTNITSGGSVQLVCDSNGNAWIRMKYSLSLWSAYRKITYNVLPIPALSTFDNIGIIGDSWSSGSVYTAQSTYAHHAKLRWGYIASKKYGFTPAFFTSPGASTKTWLTRDAGLPAMEAASAQDLYICCLGVNDHAQGLAIGVAADMDDETSTTFYGSYGQIIRAIKAKAQYAKIAIALIPKYNDTVDVSSYNTAIRAIANHFGVGLLDTEENDFFAGDVFAADRQYNHLTAVGYSAMADAINTMLGKSFANQHDYWKYSMINI